MIYYIVYIVLFEKRGTVMTQTRTVQVNRWGDDLGIRLPKEFIEKIRLTDASRLEVSMTDSGLFITRANMRRSHIPLSERFKDYKGGYKGEIVDWGEDVGNEVCD